MHYKKTIFTTISTLVIFLISANFIFAQKTYYVSPSGNDQAIGNLLLPFKTIQSAVSKASSNDTIYIREGAYRESVQINSSKNGLSLLAYPGEKPVIKGSEVMTNWIPHGVFWNKFVDIQPQQVMINGDNPLQQIGYPNYDFKNNQSYPRYEFPVGAGLSDMSPGRFFWQNDTLYIMLKDGGNPNDKTIEVSQLQRVLFIDAANVHVKGLYFRHSNSNTFGEFGAAIELGDNTLLEDCDVQWSDFGGISMGYLKTGAKAINCNSSNNGATGFDASGSFNFLISSCKANNNNYRNFYAQWHAGGFKGTTASWGIIENSEFGNNIGAGVWFDYCFENSKYRTDGHKPIVIRNNYIHDNSKTSNKNSALMIEVSEYASLQNNLVINNDYRGIYIAGSWDCNVINNVVAYNQDQHAIDIAGMPSNGGKLINNYIANNIIYNNNTTDDIEIFEDNGIDIKNNLCDYNLFYRESGNIILRYSNNIYNSIENLPSSYSFGEHNISINPIFIDNLFHISTQSPAINAGTPIIAEISEKDYDGNNRLIGCKTDMGAYESLSGNFKSAHDASLNSLTVNIGSLVPSFSPCVFNYVDSFPEVTTEIPIVTISPNNKSSVVEIINVVNIHSVIESEKTSTIKIIAEDGHTSYTYKIIFSPKKTVIPVTGIAVSGTAGANNITTDNGTLQLSASVSPSNATNKTIIWSLVNGTGQASIGASGLVTAIASGTVTAKATANDGSGIYATKVITISNQLILVTGITVSGTGGVTNITTANGTLQLSASVSPSNATNKTIIWSIANATGQASIGASGLVTAITTGTVTVKATANDGTGIYGTLVITIYNQLIAVTSIAVSIVGRGTNIIAYNGTLQLATTMAPSNATVKDVTWSIVNGLGHATINPSGLVTALDNGTVTIMATAVDGSGVNGTFIITISNQIIPVTNINITNENGSDIMTTENSTLQLNATILPVTASNKKVNWSVVNITGQASISTNGLVKAKNSGIVEIIATAADGSGIKSSLDISIKTIKPLVIIVKDHQMMVRFDESYISCKVSLYNLQGTLIRSKLVDSDLCVFDISSLPPGIYIVVLSKSMILKVGKVLIPG